MKPHSLLTPLLLLPFLLEGLNGSYSIGMGAQSKGMGGVGIALPQEAFTSANNPAGLSFLPTRIDIEADLYHFSGSNQDQTGKTSSQTTRIFPNGALNFNTGRCSLGLATYITALLATQYHHPLPLEGTSPLSSTIKTRLFSPAISGCFAEGQSIGIALNVALSHVRFNGLEALIPLSNAPEEVTNRGTESASGLNLRIGWMGRFLDYLYLGFAYQTPTWHHKLERYRGFLPDHGDFGLPSSFLMGFAFVLPTRFAFGIDFGWNFWTNNPIWGNAATTEEPIEEKFYGASHGPGFGWQDQFVFKAGGAFELNDCWTFRLGYNYGHSPVHPHQVYANVVTLATPEHHLTLGTTFTYRCNQWTLAYLHAFAHRVTGGIPPKLGGGSRRICAHQNEVVVSYGRIF